MSDGGLRQLFQKNITQAHWQGIETWSTGQGVPDMNGCLNGADFWIENKLTNGWAVHFEFGQVAWIERRVRAGGRAFVAVRRQAAAGPRRGAATDELWLYAGSKARLLSEKGLKNCRPLGLWAGGPAAWRWDQVVALLTG